MVCKPTKPILNIFFIFILETKYYMKALKNNNNKANKRIDKFILTITLMQNKNTLRSSPGLSAGKTQ